MALTPQQYAFFESFGYLVLPGLLTDDIDWMAEEHRAIFERKGMVHDGTKKGFAVELTKQMHETVNIPVIASGGAGKVRHFVEIFKQGNADAALAASIFHFGEVMIPDLKSNLKRQNIPIR